jgi:4-amino-4-deoxy-L-arabinose transferase-like glycosyltransferase
MLGILIGLATLAKLSGFVLVGAVPIILLINHLRQRSRKQSTWRLIAYCAVLVAVACLIPMPWFVRNLRLYGTVYNAWTVRRSG